MECLLRRMSSAQFLLSRETLSGLKGVQMSPDSLEPSLELLAPKSSWDLDKLG